jgi:hypothetical protein
MNLFCCMGRLCLTCDGNTTFVDENVATPTYWLHEHYDQPIVFKVQMGCFYLEQMFC